MDEATKARIESIEANARAKVSERDSRDTKDSNWSKRTAYIPSPPIVIASTEGVGTVRVRANHIDAAIDYFSEQEKLKIAGTPL